MLDWGSRIDELEHLISREYAVNDRMAVEVLLAGLINCPRTASIWTILETNWYSRYCEDAWFAFGGRVAAVLAAASQGALAVARNRERDQGVAGPAFG